jgi:hypothetical protein
VTAGRPSILLSLLFVCLPSALRAQDRVAAAPSVYKVEIDNAWVRVLRETIDPGVRIPPYDHPPQIEVTLEPVTGRVTFEPASRGSDVMNRSGKRSETIVIELKQKPPTSNRIALDPVRIDPRYHSVLFENEFVRAIRTVLEPGITSPLHEHPHYVVVYLTELHTTMKLGDGREVDNPRHTGDVGWRDYMKHQTLNIGKETAAEIQVELK